MGKHEQALFMYVHVLKDTKMAEEYVDPDTPPPRGPKSRPPRARRGVRGYDGPLPSAAGVKSPPVLASGFSSH